ncbi:MAG: hypothetical protein KatS3mg002_1344 [Candidatus Woesearchaeota archaeon]|nr:MAG: hypothetical protein KatS3mg002_1344 [Candidatus Woesearchaeota archaeon]
MATYIPNITDIIPAPMLYTPDVNFQLQSGIQAATSYENKKKQLEEYWGKFYYSEIYNPYVDNRRKEHLLSIQKYINQYANMDLRDPDVVSSFQNLFTNIASDNIVMNGIKVSEQYREEKQFQNYLKVSGIYDEGDPEKKSYAMYDPDLDRMLDIQIEEYSRMSLDDPRLASYKIDKNLIGVDLNKLISDHLKQFGIDEGAGSVKYYMLDQNGHMAEITETEANNLMRQQLSTFGSGSVSYSKDNEGNIIGAAKSASATSIGVNPIVAKITSGGVSQVIDLTKLTYDIYSNNGLVREYIRNKSKAEVYETLKVNNFDYIRTVESLISDLRARSNSITYQLSAYQKRANQLQERADDLASTISLYNDMINNNFSFDDLIKISDMVKQLDSIKKEKELVGSNIDRLESTLNELKEMQNNGIEYIITPDLFHNFIENKFLPLYSNIRLLERSLEIGHNLAMNKFNEKTQVITGGTSTPPSLSGLLGGIGGFGGSGGSGGSDDDKFHYTFTGYNLVEKGEGDNKTYNLYVTSNNKTVTTDKDADLALIDAQNIKKANEIKDPSNNIEKATKVLQETLNEMYPDFEYKFGSAKAYDASNISGLNIEEPIKSQLIRMQQNHENIVHLIPHNENFYVYVKTVRTNDFKADRQSVASAKLFVIPVVRKHSQIKNKDVRNQLYKQDGFLPLLGIKY